MKNCGIYKIVNLVDGKLYIGSSVSITERLMQHKYRLRGKRHDNAYLQNAFNKYGENMFIFSEIEKCTTENLIERENYYITKFGSNELKNGYNLALVNEFRRNTFNEVVKEKQSVLNLKKYGNFTKFKSININTGKEIIFESLVSAANYLIEEGFAKAKTSNIRQRISWCLRGIKSSRINRPNPSARNQVNKHKWVIIE